MLDASSQRLHLYDVRVDVEPGLFHVTVDEGVPLPAAVEAFAQLLQRAPHVKSYELFEVPAPCISEGSSFAANHVSDMSCRSFTCEMVRNSYLNALQGWVSGPVQQQTAIAYARTPEGPRRIKIVVRTPDNSRIGLEATLEIDIEGNLLVSNVTTVRATANSIDLPLQASDMRGQSYSVFASSVFNDFRRMFSNWSVDNSSRCSSQQRIVCPPEPGAPCISYIYCAPRP